MKSLKIEAIKTFIELQLLNTKNTNTKGDNMVQQFIWGKESAYEDITDYIKQMEEME